MLTEVIIAEFVTALAAELVDTRKDILTQQAAVQRELNSMATKIEGIMQSIERGLSTHSLIERLKGLEARQGELQEQ